MHCEKKLLNLSFLGFDLFFFFKDFLDKILGQEERSEKIKIKIIKCLRRVLTYMLSISGNSILPMTYLITIAL